jgi:hypothetical protein
MTLTSRTSKPYNKGRWKVSIEITIGPVEKAGSVYILGIIVCIDFKFEAKVSPN